MKYLKIFERFDFNDIEDILIDLIDSGFLRNSGRPYPFVSRDATINLKFDISSKFRNIVDLKTLLEYSKSISELSSAINKFNTFVDKIKISIDFTNSSLKIALPVPEKIKQIIKNCYYSSDNKFCYISVNPRIAGKIEDFDYEMFKSEDIIIRFDVDDSLEVLVDVVLPKKHSQEYYKDKDLMREAFDKVINHFTETYDISFIREEEMAFGFHFFFK